MPWQQHAADVALEIDPETGELWYEEVVITVPRQSGKTTLILAIFVWRCIVMAGPLGPQICTYIAQSGKMARRKLEREFAPILRRASKLIEINQASRRKPQKPAEWKLSMNNNGEHIAFGTGSFLQIDPPTEDAAHGDVLDMPVIDEAFSREDDLVEQAVDAATVTRRSPQSWIVSTVGNERSFFLGAKVLAGRAAINDPKSRTCYLEWSVPDDADYADPKVWAEFLPALGHTITVERLLSRLDKAQRNPDQVDADGFEPGIAGFKRGYCNIWPRFPQLSAVVSDAVIAADEWKAMAVEQSDIVGRTVLGVGISADQITASIVLAGRTETGQPQIEVLHRAPGTSWLEKMLGEFVVDWQPAFIAWNNDTSGRPLAPDIKRACGMSPETAAMPLAGAEWKASCQAFANTVADGGLVHLGDDRFDTAVAGGFRQELTDGWRWDLSAATSDITPLVAATAAMRALGFADDSSQSRKSAYEDGGVFMV